MSELNEELLLEVANKYTGKCTDAKKVQKLGEEVVELAMGIAVGDTDNILEEIGDCMFILLDLKNRFFPDLTIEAVITIAAEKMVKRNRYIG